LKTIEEERCMRAKSAERINNVYDRKPKEEAGSRTDRPS